MAARPYEPEIHTDLKDRMDYGGYLRLMLQHSAGSHIKIESANARGPEATGIRCYYFVRLLNNEYGSRTMTWAWRSGSSPECPRAGTYRGTVRY